MPLVFNSSIEQIKGSQLCEKKDAGGRTQDTGQKIGRGERESGEPPPL